LSNDLSHIEEFKNEWATNMILFHRVLEEPIANIINMPIPVVNLLVDVKNKMEKKAEDSSDGFIPF